jgi:glucose-1-phosphate thymidylyltransferase
MSVGGPEEVAWRQGWIDDARLSELAAAFGDTAYGQALRRLLDRRV